MSALDEMVTKLSARLRGVDPERRRALVALSALASRIIMIDLHFSPVEARRLRGALARTAIDFDACELVAGLVETDARSLRHVPLDEAGEAVRDGLGQSTAGVYDALVDLAAAAGVRHGAFPLMAIFGASVSPADRAAELGIEAGVDEAYVGVSAASVHYDDQRMSIGDQLYEVTIGWNNLVRFDAVDPWPRVRIAWRERGYPGRAFFTARWETEAFAARIEALFHFARARLSEHDAHKLERGWVGRPDVEWERVAHLPVELVAANDGAYRTSARARPTEPILARRDAPSSLERLLLYLGTGPDARWSDRASGAVVLTDAHLYAERRHGAVARLPLSALRARIGGRDGTYIFGKRTRVLLPQRTEPCPVAQQLDAILRAR